MRPAQLVARTATFLVVAPLVIKLLRSKRESFQQVSILAGGITAWELAKLLRKAGLTLSPSKTAAWTAIFTIVPAQTSKGLTARSIPEPSDRNTSKSQRFNARLCALLLAGAIRSGLKLRHREDGKDWLTWGFLTTWGTDAACYLLGPMMGGPSLPAWLNPKKKWLGYVPGLLVGVASGRLASSMLKLRSSCAMTLGFFVAVAATIGDILESAIKRRARVRDSGSMLPGYGGLLDRMDSLLLTTPVVYLAAELSRRRKANAESSQLLVQDPSMPRAEGDQGLQREGAEGRTLVPLNHARAPSSSSQPYRWQPALVALGAFYALCLERAFDSFLQHIDLDTDLTSTVQGLSWSAWDNDFVVLLVGLVTYILWLSTFFLYGIRIYLRIPHDTSLIGPFIGYAVSLSGFYFLAASIGPPRQIQIVFILIITSSRLLVPGLPVLRRDPLAARVLWGAKTIVAIGLPLAALMFVPADEVGAEHVYLLFGLIVANAGVSHLEERRSGALSPLPSPDEQLPEGTRA